MPLADIFFVVVASRCSSMNVRIDLDWRQAISVYHTYLRIPFSVSLFFSANTGSMPINFISTLPIFSTLFTFSTFSNSISISLSISFLNIIQQSNYTLFIKHPLFLFTLFKIFQKIIKFRIWCQNILFQSETFLLILFCLHEINAFVSLFSLKLFLELLYCFL